MEEIDYKAVCEQIQHELEQARLEILKLRNVRNPLEQVDGDKLRAFVQKNYLLIIVGMMLVSFIIGSMKTIKEIMRRSYRI
jgi:hypothetical protein